MVKGGMLPLLKLNKMKLRKLTKKDEFLKLDGLVNDKMVNELIEENAITETTCYECLSRGIDDNCENGCGDTTATSPEITDLILESNTLITMVHIPKPQKRYTMIKYSEIEKVSLGKLNEDPLLMTSFDDEVIVKNVVAKFMSGEYKIHSIGNYIFEIEYYNNYGARIYVKRPNRI